METAAGHACQMLEEVNGGWFGAVVRDDVNGHARPGQLQGGESASEHGEKQGPGIISTKCANTVSKLDIKLHQTPENCSSKTKCLSSISKNADSCQNR